MKYSVPGQDDVSVAVGGGGDKTVVIATTTTHVRLTNESANQLVMYSEVNVPSYPGDWRRLSPKETLVVRMNGGGPNLYLRKKTWYRSVGTKFKADLVDTPVTVEVEQIEWT